MSISAKHSTQARAPLGVSEHDMAGGWIAVIARRADSARSWYYKRGDDPRLLVALRKQAHEWCGNA